MSPALERKGQSAVARQQAQLRETRRDRGDFHHHGMRHEWKARTKPHWSGRERPDGWMCPCGLRRYRSNGHWRYVWDGKLRPEKAPHITNESSWRRPEFLPECPPCDRYDVRPERRT